MKPIPVSRLLFFILWVVMGLWLGTLAGEVPPVLSGQSFTSISLYAWALLWPVLGLVAGVQQTPFGLAGYAIVFLLAYLCHRFIAWNWK